MFEKFAIFMALLLMASVVFGSDEAQRIEKRSRQQSGNNDDFEKFFLKASKSVPRIGRRRIEEPPPNSDAKLPLWAELSDLYEYNPELFASPQLLTRWLEYYNSQLLREDAKATEQGGALGGWSPKMRFKRDPLNDELDEYRQQP